MGRKSGHLATFMGGRFSCFFLFFFFFCIGNFSKTEKKICTDFLQEALKKCCDGIKRV